MNKTGRKLTCGRFKTRAELVETVLRLSKTKMRQYIIATHCGVSAPTINNILKRQNHDR